MQQWPFDSPATTACLAVRDVMAGTRPILEVHRDPDGDWQFLPGVEVSEADAMVVSLAEVLQLDESLVAVADLPPGYFALRASETERWQRQRSAANDE
ncbi:hypothetical protein [Variovorax fucosicus]|uniref:hypothetical protein n=1 Tax=Variovorax fucosicus TaxID=3053517 RepID=UPI0025763A10|nr:hypothetical protein [Variovorax sp. J22G47]MDM0056839.1 hypothetical protein [Variovorax sp. J22G47]